MPHNPRIHRLLVAVRTECVVPFVVIRAAVEKAINEYSGITKLRPISIARVAEPHSTTIPNEIIVSFLAPDGDEWEKWPEEVYPVAPDAELNSLTVDPGEEFVLPHVIFHLEKGVMLRVHQFRTNLGRIWRTGRKWV